MFTPKFYKLVVFICFYSTFMYKIHLQSNQNGKTMFDIFNTIFKYKEKASPDKLGLYPEHVHVDAMPERRYLWTSRVLVIIACFSICFNMMLAASLYVMLPQRGSAPQLFYIDKYFSQIERMQPFEMIYPVGNLITEEHITNYIMMRYIITNDYDELARRWGAGSYIYWLSSPDVYDQFTKFDAKYNLSQFRLKNMMRDVEIDWIRPLTRGLWQTQFRTLDYLPGQEDPIISTWRATMRIQYVNFNPNQVTHEDALKNPFGFLVTNYSLSYLGLENDTEHYLSQAKRITRELFFR